MENQKQIEEKASHIRIQQMAYVGLGAALLGVISQLSVPMPGGAPATLQIFGIVLIGIIFGWKTGAAAVAVYLCIGAVGVPVFANFKGGIGMLAGTTGGYLLSFPILAGFAGMRHKKTRGWKRMAVTFLWTLGGLAVVEIAGGVQWSLVAGGAWTLTKVFTYALVAFVPKDILLVVLGVFTGELVRKALAKGKIYIS